jgi:hypothetical protein
VLGGVEGNLHLTVPSMNRLNQTEAATFSIFAVWAFLWILIFSILLPWSTDVHRYLKFKVFALMRLQILNVFVRKRVKNYLAIDLEKIGN